MLRLWPDHLTLGVFPKACWLQKARGHELASTDIHRPVEGRALLDEVDALLEQRAAQLKRGTEVDVVVSDAIGVTAALPWQDKLGSASLVRSYARMLLESQGRLDSGAWTVEGGFRHFAGAGLAAALPDDWITQLVEVLASHGLRLRGVQPLSAVAYWQFSKQGRRNQSLLLLDEGGRITALLYRAGRLHCVDAQPTLNTLDENVERLCRRLLAVHGDMVNVWIWSIDTSEGLAKAVTRCIPGADGGQLALGQWRRN